MNQLTLKKVASVTGLFLGAFALSVIAADWTPAGCGAPGCNVSAPINVSSNQQTKLGALAIRNASQNPNGSSLDVRGTVTSEGLLVEGIATADTVDVLRTLKVAGANSTQANWVLANKGGGEVEWKAQNTSNGVTVSEVKRFTLSVPRDDGDPPVNPPVTTSTAPTAYLFCALTFMESEMGRVNKNEFSDSYCQITKNDDGTWTLSGDNNDDPPYQCDMTCFK